MGDWGLGGQTTGYRKSPFTPSPSHLPAGRGADERRLTVLCHAGRGIPALGKHALQACSRYPNMRLILAHAGGTAPYVRDRILDRAPILRRMQRAREGEASPPTAEELQRLVAQFRT